MKLGRLSELLFVFLVKWASEMSLAQRRVGQTLQFACLAADLQPGRFDSCFRTEPYFIPSGLFNLSPGLSFGPQVAKAKQGNCQAELISFHAPLPAGPLPLSVGASKWLALSRAE